jgi:hypothetical protein
MHPFFLELPASAGRGLTLLKKIAARRLPCGDFFSRTSAAIRFR